MNPAVNSSLPLEDASCSASPEISSNKDPVFKVKTEDHNAEMAKLKYIHKLAVKEEMRYRSIHHCDECGYESKSIFFMLNHVRRHRFPLQSFDCATSKVELYHCENCDINFDSVVHLRNHIKKKHSVNKEMEDYPLKGYMCSTCFFGTGSALQSLKHVRAGCLMKTFKNKTKEKSPTKISNCEESQYKITPEYTLSEKWYCEKYKGTKKGNSEKQFMAKHTDDKDKKLFQCNKCLFKTSRRGRLKGHIGLKHTDGNETPWWWFHCEKCTYKSARKSYLKSHIMTKHTDDKDKKWFNCERCTYKATEKRRLDTHILAKHTDDKNKKWIFCEKCTFKTIHKSSLKKHDLNKHVDDKDKKWFNCEKCIYKSSEKSQLNKHIFSNHTDDQNKKWLYCEKCTYKTIWTSGLKKHNIAKHTDDKRQKVDLL